MRCCGVRLDHRERERGRGRLVCRVWVIWGRREEQQSAGFEISSFSPQVGGARCDWPSRGADWPREPVLFANACHGPAKTGRAPALPAPPAPPAHSGPAPPQHPHHTGPHTPPRTHTARRTQRARESDTRRRFPGIPSKSPPMSPRPPTPWSPCFFPLTQPFRIRDRRGAGAVPSLRNNQTLRPARGRLGAARRYFLLALKQFPHQDLAASLSAFVASTVDPGSD